VLRCAYRDAQRYNHAYISTEHILLGLVKAGSGSGATVLANHDIDLLKIRREFEKVVRCEADPILSRNLAQTPGVKKVIDYALEEARDFGHDHVDTEHLLLGLLREQEGMAAQILMSLKLQLEDVREEVLELRGPATAVKGSRARQIEPTLQEDRYAGFRHLLPEQALQALKEVETPWEDPNASLQYLLPEQALQAVKEIKVQIEQLNHEEDAAVAECDLAKAARLADQVNELHQKRAGILRDSTITNHPLWTLKELAAQIEQLPEEQKAAVAEQDFKKAAHLRDQVDRLKRKREVILRQWCHQEASGKQGKLASRDDPKVGLGHVPEPVLLAQKQLAAQIEHLTVEKERAVANSDFEKAAHLRDQIDELKKERANLLSRWHPPSCAGE
jgi:ATP-dependent Clp protease ATP-binding subunit ClpA